MTEIEEMNPMANPVDIPEAPGYMEPEYEPATKIWTFLLDEEPYSIVFCKEKVFRTFEMVNFKLESPIRIKMMFLIKTIP